MVFAEMAAYVCWAFKPSDLRYIFAYTVQYLYIIANDSEMFK